jgi:hypothetical protein
MERFPRPAAEPRPPVFLLCLFRSGDFADLRLERRTSGIIFASDVSLHVSNESSSFIGVSSLIPESDDDSEELLRFDAASTNVFMASIMACMFCMALAI